MFALPGSALFKSSALILPLAAMVLGFAGRPTAAPAPAPNPEEAAPNQEEAAVRVPLEAYLDAQASGLPDPLRRAFHTESRVLSMRDGAFTKVEIADFIARYTGKRAADEAQRKRSIDSIDIVGDAAIARITLDYPTIKYSDYMTLLKVGNEWRIVSKVFSADERPAAERTPPASPSPEEAGVRVALDAYLDGHATGRADSFRRAFHPEARMLFMRDGAFNKVEIPDYIARATGKPAADEAQRKRSIDSIDIVGDAARARITLDYPDVKFTDYMALLKVNGEWRIVSKVFSADRRPAAQRKSS